MTKDIVTEIPMTRIEIEDDRFGICPICGGCDYFLNIGRSHWMVCEQHKLKWQVGENLFRCWRFETEDDWRRNADTLSGFTEVQAAYRNSNILPVEVAAAVDSILDHFWSDEASDYSTTDPAARENHIFRQLHALDCWMKGMPPQMRP